MLFKRIKDWATSISAFRSGDVIPVDGPSGTAKMAKDKLLELTAENVFNTPNAVTGTPVATFGDPLTYKVTSKITQATYVKYDASLINGRTLDITYNNNESSGVVYFQLYFRDKDANLIRHDVWACTAGTPLHVSTIVPSGSEYFVAESFAYTLADWSIFVIDNIEKRLEDTADLADNNGYNLDLGVFGATISDSVTTSKSTDTNIAYDVSKITGRTISITYSNDNESGTSYFQVKFIAADGTSIKTNTYDVSVGTPVTKAILIPDNSSKMTVVNFAYTKCSYSFYVVDNISARLSENEDSLASVYKDVASIDSAVFGATISDSVTTSKSTDTNIAYDVSKITGRTISITYSNDNESGTSYFQVKFIAADGTSIKTNTYDVSVGTPVTKAILIPDNSSKMTVVNFAYTKCSYSFYVVDNISARLSENEDSLASVYKDVASIDSAVFGATISDSVTTSKSTTTNIAYDVSRIGGKTLSITLSNDNESGTIYQDIFLLSEDGSQLARWTEAVLAGTPKTIIRKVPTGAVRMTVISSAYAKASWSFYVVDNIDDSLENLGEYSHVLSVKKDGTGDFTSIQAAVSSCSVPGKFNRYKIEVFDDFEITNITDLFTSIGTHTSAPDRALSVFWPRDYVDVVGMNGRRKISVIMPSNLDPEYLKWIQPVYGQQTFKLENFELVVKNGRYALHQDNVHDVNAHTIYKNIRCIHLGNDDYQSGWKSELAAAFGTTSGMTLEFIDCEFVTKKNSPWYFHTQLGFSTPSRVIIDNCSFNGNFNHIRLGISSEELGSGCSNFFEIRNCALPIVRTANRYSLIAQSRTDSNKNYWKQKMQVIGDKGLQKRILEAYTLPVAVLFSTDGISEVDVVGGSAADALWIEAHKKGAVSFGSSYIGSSAFSLASMLGDCSVDNKTLVVSVGGEEQTINLDSDYTSMSNSDIISWINDRLSGASFSITEKTYDLLNGDYFETPAQSNLEFGEIISNGFESGVVSVKTSAGDIVRCAKCKSNYFLTADIGNVGTEVADGVVEFS